MDDWHLLAYDGDEWLVAYACIPAAASSVTLFAVGHAVELYMKATHTKLYGDINKSIKLGHNIKGLWDACKSYDKAFMPAYEIRDSIYSRDFLDGKVFSTFSVGDQKHFISHQSLYIISKHLQDLKYFGLPWTTRKKAGPMCYIHPNPFWVKFFKDLRQYLGYPPKNNADRIAQILESNVLPLTATQYLRQL